MFTRIFFLSALLLFSAASTSLAHAETKPKDHYCSPNGIKEPPYKKSDVQAFQEKLKNNAIEMVEFSRAEAQLIEYCYGSTNTPYSAWESFPETQRSLKSHCKTLKQKVNFQTKNLREFRLQLALSKPRFRSDVVSTNLPVSEKISLHPQALHTDIEPARLSEEEVKEAVKRFDSFILKTVKEKFPYYDYESEIKKLPMYRSPPEGLNAYLRYRLETWRNERYEKAKEILEQNPLLSHFTGPYTNDLDMQAAAKHLQKRSDEFLEELKAMRPGEVSSHLILLFELGGNVDATIASYPELCQGANYLKAQAEGANYRKQIYLTAAVPIVGAACTLLTRAPMWCFSVAGSISGAVYYVDVHSEYKIRKQGLDAAFDKNRSLIKAIGELDSKERSLLFAGILVLLPVEAVFGKGWIIAERNPYFHRVTMQLGDKMRSDGKHLYEVIMKQLH